MVNISSTQLKAILEVSDLAAESASESHLPPLLLDKLTKLFGSKSCVFYSMGDGFEKRPIWDGVGYNLNPSSVLDYERHFSAFDPCFAGLRKRAQQGDALVVSTDQVIASERNYRESGYYQDFLLPQRIHSSIIFAVGDAQGLLGLFGFHRGPGKPIYGAQEHLKAQLVASQVAAGLRLRALSNTQQRLRALVARFMERASITDYLVVDRDWQVVDGAGPVAKSIAPISSTLVVDEYSRGRRFTPPRKIRSHFFGCRHRRQTLGGEGDCGTSQNWRIFDDIPGWPRVLVDLLEVGNEPPLLLLAFLPEEPDLISNTKLSEFRFTPRETQVVRILSRGLSNKQIAEHLGVSEKTVDHHLEHMFRKTGTRNRTALICCLAG